MTILDDLLLECDITEEETRWVGLVLNEDTLLAGLANADVIFWLRRRDGDFVSAAHMRPQGIFTLFHRDFVGKSCPKAWSDVLSQAYSSGEIVSYEEQTNYGLVNILATPVNMKLSNRQLHQTPLVVTSHRISSDLNQKIQSVYQECSRELFGMLSRGDFPRLDSPTGSRFGIPRATDGLMRLHESGNVAYASPKAVSVFKTLGVSSEIEGKNLAKVVVDLVEQNDLVVDESLPLVVTGRADWTAEVQVNGANVVFRSIPLRNGPQRHGAILLCRDITEQRSQQMQLMTRDATIREIHHRIKNSLQAVSAMLRLQSRRSDSEAVRIELNEAVRRISAVAMVHDALSEGISQDLDFDELFPKLIRLITEANVLKQNEVKLKIRGSLGTLNSQYATPLMLVLIELVANAIEHGLAGEPGELIVAAQRRKGSLYVIVSDNGKGIDLERLNQGLGTQIISTIAQAELSGRISWGNNPFELPEEIMFEELPSTGTTAILQMPLTGKESGRDSAVAAASASRPSLENPPLFFA